MKYPVRYTYLGFYINSLVDEGETLDLNETHEKIRNKTLFKWLKEKFPEKLDISLYTEEELNAIESFFESISVAVDEDRKMGITKNGLCLLVAYCLEALQHNPEKY
ncbi:hypothetical protein [Lutibacter sp. B1]|uniref:hypothetical protein n=1 Tax=Lutibacter sp. B1 TaxID=2725996 RepID=UPI00145767F6|nr:hypothetical protein [Lutibacter sp. B1]NLP59399.1 hypothetical protein [Lutibacter sp. B1]